MEGWERGAHPAAGALSAGNLGEGSSRGQGLGGLLDVGMAVRPGSWSTADQAESWGRTGPEGIPAGPGVVRGNDPPTAAWDNLLGPEDLVLVGRHTDAPPLHIVVSFDGPSFCLEPCAGRFQGLDVVRPVLHTVAPSPLSLLAGTLVSAAGSGPYCH